MNIDPALIGTTFGAALEAAARDEQLKREQREREKNGVANRARLVAEALRGHTPAPTPVTPTALSQHDKRREWARQAMQSTLSTSTPMETSDMTQTIPTTVPYSQAQIDILALGAEADNARVPRGNFTKRLFDDGLIVRTTDGHYKTTDKGIAAWRTAKTITSADTSPHPSTAPQASTVIADTPKPSSGSIEIAAMKLQNHQLTEQVNTRGEKIEALTLQVSDLKQEIAALKAQIATGAPTGESTPEMATLQARIAELEQQLEAAQSVQEAYTRLREQLLDPLIALIRRDDIVTMSADDLLRDPGYIVRYMGAIRESLKIHSDRSEEQTQRLEQQDATIESLRRCVEEYKAEIEDGQRRAKVADQHSFAALILDELCELLPEIEAYRTARETAQAAIASLKARRP